MQIVPTASRANQAAGTKATAAKASGDRAAAARCRPTASNHVWAYDFVFDTCANGQPLEVSHLIDE